MNKIEIMDNLVKRNNGYFVTSEAVAEGVSKTYIAEYIKKRELEKIKAAPTALVVMIAVPIIVCFILLQTFSAGSPKDLPIAVVDNDNTNLSLMVREGIFMVSPHVVG